MIKKKVMVEVGDLAQLKRAIEVYESWHGPATKALVELAKRVVAEEERIQAAIDAPVDIDSY